MRGFLTPFIKKILEYLFVTVTDGDIVFAKGYTYLITLTYITILNIV